MPSAKNISMRKIYEIQREISKSRRERETNKQAKKTNQVTEANFKSWLLGNRPGVWRTRLNLQIPEKEPEARNLSPEVALGNAERYQFCSRSEQKCKYALYFVFPLRPGKRICLLLPLLITCFQLQLGHQLDLWYPSWVACNSPVFSELKGISTTSVTSLNMWITRGTQMACAGEDVGQVPCWGLWALKICEIRRVTSQGVAPGCREEGMLQ